MKKRMISAILLVVFLFALCAPQAGRATYFNDTSRHWAAGVIDTWSNYGIIQGTGGLFKPDENITRADLAVIISRVMGLKKESQSVFLDLDSCSSEQRSAILKLNAIGIMKGDQGFMRPGDSISREEAAVMLGRTLRLDEVGSAYTLFRDTNQISSWALGMVRAMALNGYISGRPDGSFDPKATITRAEAVKLLDNMVKGYYCKAGTYSISTLGNVVIACTGVELKKVAITGDLFIAESVGEGTVTLNDVTVQGNVYVMGGGTKSLKLLGNTRLGNVYHEKTGAAGVRYSALPPAGIDFLHIPQGTSPVEFEGVLKTMYINASNHSVSLFSAEIGTLHANAAGISLTADANSCVNVAQVNQPIRTLGAGSLTTVSLSAAAAGSSFERQPKISVLPPGITVFMAGEPVKNTSGRVQTITASGDLSAPVVVNTALSAAKLTADGATVSWAAAADDVTAQSGLRYALYYSTSSYLTKVSEIETNGMMLTAYGTNRLTADISGLKYGVTYYLNVIVKDQAENKSCYARMTLKIGNDTAPPGIPNPQLELASIKTTEVTLNWRKAVDSITPEKELKYAVYRAESPYLSTVSGCEAYGKLVMPFTKDVSTCRITGLTENKVYYFNVIVMDDVNNKSCYVQISATPTKDATSPAVPVPKITVSQITDSGAVISWTPASDAVSQQSALKYALYYSASPNIDTVTNIKNNGKTALLPMTANRLSYAFSSTEPGPHYVNVLVQDEASNQSCYTMLTINLGPDTSVPVIPDPAVTVSGWTNQSVSLSWTAAEDQPGFIPGSAGIELQYAVYRVRSADLPGGSGAFDSVAEIEANADWHSAFTPNIQAASVSGLASNQAYLFNVIVQDTAGYKACYSPVTGITDKTAPAVTYAAVAGTPGADGGQLTLQWSPAYDEITTQSKLEYAVFYSDNIAFSEVSDIEGTQLLIDYTKASDLGALEATMTGIPYSTPYFFYVLVRDEAGNKTKYTTLHYERLDVTPPVLPVDSTITATPTAGTAPERFIIDLSWLPALDDVTEQENLMYSVYFADAPGLYTTPALIETAGLTCLVRGKGITHIAHPDRPPGTYFYFVVVEDFSGNKTLYSECQIVV